jgi:hypothetical protein
MLVTSMGEVSLPGFDDFISATLDDFLHLSELLIGVPRDPRQRHLGRQPELGLPFGRGHVHVLSAFLSRKEEKALATMAENRWAHPSDSI